MSEGEDSKREKKPERNKKGKKFKKPHKKFGILKKKSTFAPAKTTATFFTWQGKKIKEGKRKDFEKKEWRQAGNLKRAPKNISK